MRGNKLRCDVWYFVFQGNVKFVFESDACGEFFLVTS